MPFTLHQLRFKPSLVPSLAALVGLSLTLYLGQWQQGRAAEKRGLQAEYDARVVAPPVSLNRASAEPTKDRFRPAVVRGRYEVEGQFFVDNKSQGSMVGYYVVTPFRVADADRWILVNRGWVARSKAYPKPPIVRVPTEELTLAGSLYAPTEKFIELSKNTVDGAVWQNLSIQRYAEATKRQVEPLVLLINGQEGLVSVAERPDARVEKHVEYMLTWYSLAATIVLLWLGLNLKVNRMPPTTSSHNP